VIGRVGYPCPGAAIGPRRELKLRFGNDQRRKCSGTHDSETEGAVLMPTHRSASRRLNHSRIWFQLANVDMARHL
jgi:hypothetical protein